MSRLTKKQKCQRNLARLAEAFGTTVPTLALVANPGCRGLYWSDTKHITLSPRAPLETLCHEFAHHLDYEREGSTAEPPKSLPEVRAFVCPGRSFTSLEYSALDHVDKTWK